MVPFTRWAIFLLIGYPFQILFSLIYLPVSLFWKTFIYTPMIQLSPEHDDVRELTVTTRDGGLFLDNTDDHGAMTMYGFIKEFGLACLIYQGNFLRRYNGPGDFNQKLVSGDVVVSWVFAAMHPSVHLRSLEFDVLSAAKNYLKNLGSLSDDGWVSNRCNNFGINYCPDSDIIGLGQPAAGPQFYTSSCLFAIASLYSKRWKVIFWLHWILMGGWLLAWVPCMWTTSRPLMYTRDITMKSLWVHRLIFGERWWIMKPMEFIAGSTPNHNALFDAMLGQQVGYIPLILNAFFSQRADSTSRLVPNDMNPYLSAAISSIKHHANNTDRVTLK